MEQTTSPQPSLAAKGGCFGRALGFMLRLKSVVLLAIGIGVAFHYGLVYGYQQILEPVRRQGTQIAAVGTQVEDMRASAAATQSAQAARLATVEAKAANLENALTNESTARQPLAEDVAELKNEVTALQAETAKLETYLATLTPATAKGLSQTAHIERQTALLRVQDNLLKARLQLIAENTGEARRLLADSSAALRALMEPPTVLPPETRAALLYRLANAEALLGKETHTALAEIESAAVQLEREMLQPTATPTR